MQKTPYLFLLSLVFSFGLFSQALFKEKGLKKIDSTMQLYETQQKKTWLNLVPNLNYDLKNKSFNIGFSINSLSLFYQQKQRNEIELAKLNESLISKLETNTNRLSLIYEQFEYEKETLKRNINIYKIDFDLFQISKGKYKNGEIATEDFLKLKKSYLKQQNQIQLQLFKLKKIANKIYEKEKNVKIENAVKEIILECSVFL
jgi:hypothetical protein